MLSRRRFVRLAGIALVAHAAKAAGAFPNSEMSTYQWGHGISQFGALKYPPGFRHFDYVNPDAPKGGRVRQGALGTYDNFNMAVAGLKGALAVGIELIYDSLMVPSLDEVSSSYGLIAEAACYPPDYSWAIYRLRSAARWHDGRPVTPDDVIFSLDAFKQNNPEIAAYYRNVLRAERVGDGDVRFVFDMPGNRELPLIVGQLTVLPRHWWTSSRCLRGKARRNRKQRSSLLSDRGPTESARSKRESPSSMNATPAIGQGTFR